jgi:hypothetical protein
LRLGRAASTVSITVAAASMRNGFQVAQAAVAAQQAQQQRQQQRRGERYQYRANLSKMALQPGPAATPGQQRRQQKGEAAQADAHAGDQQQEWKQENQAVDKDSAGRGLG